MYEIFTVSSYQPRTQALPLRPLGKDPGERWSHVSQNLGEVREVEGCAEYLLRGNMNTLQSR